MDLAIARSPSTEFYQSLLNTVFFTVFTFLGMFFTRQFIIKASRKIEFDIRKDLFSKLINSTPFFIQNYPVGDLVSRCTNDLEKIRTMLGPGIMYIPNSFTRIAFFTPLFWSMPGPLFASLAGCLSCIFVVNVVRSATIRPLYKQGQEQTAIIGDYVWKTIQSIDTIRLNQLESFKEKKFAQLNKNHTRINLQIGLQQSLLTPFSLFLLGITQWIVLIIGGYYVIKNQLSVGQILSYILMLSNLTFPILSLGWVLPMIQEGSIACGRIEPILTAKQEPTEKIRGKSIVTPPTIQVKNVQFFYPSAPHWKLRIPKLHITPGSFMGITGTTSSGKSTLLQILCGLLFPQNGEVFLSNKEIKSISSQTIRDTISFVPQEGFLFSKTIFENVGLKDLPHPNEDLVKICCKKARIHEDICKFKNTYNQIVGERGITLSGGQKQRMQMARSFYLNRSILLLDDPFSRIDGKTQRELLNMLLEQKNKKSIILATSRLVNLCSADHIIVLDKGTIIEEGSHKNLLKQKGLYYRLFQIQTLEKED